MTSEHVQAWVSVDELGEMPREKVNKHRNCDQRHGCETSVKDPSDACVESDRVRVLRQRFGNSRRVENAIFDRPRVEDRGRSVNSGENEAH